MFENWPGDVPRQGILSTTSGETVSFTDFRIAGNLLLMERDRPDSVGSRKVVIAFDAISTLKFADVSDLSRYSQFGFELPG